MVDDVLLTPQTYRVLERVPATWWDADQVVSEISLTLGLTVTDVRRRLANLTRLRLVESRKRNTIAPSMEIRKVGR